MDLGVLAQLRQEQAVHPYPHPLSSVAFANKILQQIRHELSESDGSPVCLGTSFLPAGVSCRDPPLEESAVHGDLAEVQDWDWRRWFAALPVENLTGSRAELAF